MRPTPFGRDGWSLVQCTETGMVFLPDPPAYQQLQSELAWESTSRAERQRRLRDEPIAARLSGVLKRVRLAIFRNRNKLATLTLACARRWPRGHQLRVVDFGCAECNLLVDTCERLRRAGYGCIPTGVEVSSALAAQGNQRLAPLGGKVICASAMDGAAQLEPESMDVALMSSFLEHEARPLELLRRLHGVLRRDGVVILKVPNFACWNRKVRGGRWCGFRYPDHVNYFTPQTLALLASEAGYEMMPQPLRDRFPLSDNMYAVLTRSVRTQGLPT